MAAICGVTTTRGWRQKGWSGGSGSTRENVERGVSDPPLVQRRQKRRVVDQDPTPGIDDKGTLRQQRQRVRIQRVFSFGGVGSNVMTPSAPVRACLNPSAPERQRMPGTSRGERLHPVT